MKKPIIEIKNLTKKYKNFYAIKDINLKIFEGEKIAIIGANGAGKSTLVDIIGGIKKKTSGQIIYNMKNPKVNIGLQIQDTSFPDGLKLIDIINFYCTVFKKSSKSKEIQELLKFFNISELKNKWVSRLSGGQRQRVNAFLTIMSDPKVLIVDEMATGLDITTKLSLIKFINNYIKKTKKTYITISHSESEVAETANRVIIMEKGKIIKDCSLKEIGGQKGIYKYFSDLRE